MALRSFTDADGTVWTVWNVVPTLARNERRLSLGTGMGDGWLCFDSGRTKRRIVPAPQGWEEWSEGELQAALSTAQEVRRGPDTPDPRGG